MGKSIIGLSIKFSHEIMNSDLTKSRLLIKNMFSEIAGTYDRANSILSFGLHHWWKKKLIWRVLQLQREKFPENAVTAEKSDFLALDVCTGTGDILKGLCNSGLNAFGVDFAYPMLKLQLPEAKIAQADALQLPFKNASFDIITVSYGVRNFESLEAGLKEICRVLKPNGTVLILEFGKKPKGLLGAAIKFYENTILPYVGGLISGKSKAYQYLAKSSNEFPSSEEFISICKKNGFADGSYKTICFGATYLYEIKV